MSTFISTIKTAPKTLALVEQKQLLQATGQYKSTFRDHVLFSLALGTGLREHEIAALTVGDIFNADGARKRVQLRVFKRSNKDEATQDIILSESLRKKLQRFYAWKKEEGESVELMAPLFVSRKKNALSTRQIRRLFVEWQEKAGFDQRFPFHALRHTACTAMYRATKDIRLTQRFARHKSIHYTERYTHSSDEERFQACEALYC